MTTADSPWPIAQPLKTTRLRLVPLRLNDAEEVAVALADARLHAFIGGRPATATELHARYDRQVAGTSPDGLEGWLNWTVREFESHAVVGTLQATLRRDRSITEAELAWVVAVVAQGRGYAGEAARAVVGWLEKVDVKSFVAHIHPEHGASAGVARALGMEPSDVMVDGEVEWRRRPPE